MQQDPYNTNPYASQDYESSPLPYVPHADSLESMSQSSNEQVNAQPNNMYPVVPYVRENTSYSQDAEITSPAVLVSSTRSKKKGRRWIALGVILLVILIATVSSFTLFSYLNRSTPTKTLDTFCTALQKGEYQTAYDQFSPTMQANFVESQFAHVLAQNKVITCSHGPVAEIGSSTSTTLQLKHISQGVNNDRVFLIKDSHSQWKISDLQVAA
jgi:hypothetical protein